MENKQRPQAADDQRQGQQQEKKPGQQNPSQSPDKGDRDRTQR